MPSPCVISSWTGLIATSAIPRGAFGSLLAISEGFEGFGFLDADNWLEPDHVELCVQSGISAGKSSFDYVVAQRHHRRPDETIIPVQEEKGHVDTNRLFMLKGSFFVAPFFATMPKQLSVVGDRLFYQALQARGLKAAVVPTKTVNDLCLWEAFYRHMGETPPPGAKPGIDVAPIEKYLDGLSGPRVATRIQPERRRLYDSARRRAAQTQWSVPLRLRTEV